MSLRRHRPDRFERSATPWPGASHPLSPVGPDSRRIPFETIGARLPVRTQIRSCGFAKAHTWRTVTAQRTRQFSDA